MKHAILKLAARLTLLGACLLPVCLASAPVLVLKNGTIVNLNTGVAIQPDGAHYQLSHAALVALELRLARERRVGAAYPPHHTLHKPIPHESRSRP